MDDAHIRPARERPDKIDVLGPGAHRGQHARVGRDTVYHRLPEPFRQALHPTHFVQNHQVRLPLPDGVMETWNERVVD